MHPLLRRIVIGRPFQIGVGLLVLYALAGFVLLPLWIERALPDYARDTLQRQASIGAVRINPFLLTLTARDFKLSEADGEPIVAFGRLFVDFETSSLFHWAWTFKAIRLEGLDLHIVRAPQGGFNLAALIDSFPKGPEPTKSGAPPRLLLWDVALVDGHVHYLDRAGKEPAGATVTPVNVELKEVALLPERRGSMSLNAKLDGGGALKMRGELALQPFSATGNLTLEGFPAATAWPFLRDRLRLAEFKGVIDLAGGFSIMPGENDSLITLNDIHLHAAGLELRERGAKAPLLALETLDAPGARIDWNQHTVTLPQLDLSDGQFGLTIDPNGTVNWANLVVADTGPPPAASAPVDSQPAASPLTESPPAKSSPVKSSPAEEPPAAPPTPAVPPVTSPPAASPSAPWKVSFDKAQLSNIAVQIVDRNRPVPLTLAAAQLGAKLKLDLEIGASTTVSTQAVDIDLGKFALQLQGDAEPALTLGAVHLDGGKLDTGARTVSMEQLTLKGGGTRLVRSAEGRLYPIDDLVGADASAPAGARADATQTAPWRYRIAMLRLQDFKAGLADQIYEPALAVDLDEITATLKDVVNDGKTPLQFDAALHVVQGGHVTATGSLAADHKGAQGKLIVDKVNLEPLQAVIARHTSLTFKTGTASAASEWAYTAKPESDPVFSADGTASLDGLLLNETRSGKRFFACKSVSASGIQYHSAPAGLTIADVRVIEPDAKVLIFPDRTLNLIKAFEKPGADRKAPAPATTQATDAGRFAIKVARVRLERGKVDYTDQSLVLPFSTEIRDFHGSLTGISSDPASRAAVDFEGRVEQYGSAKVSGTLSPFAPKRYMDIHTEFRNVEMPKLSPYTATFAGREIASGKLSLNLEYKIDEGKLAGDNQVLLDHFTLGKSVESKDALDLPLDLAVALLTDTQGRIDLAIPVSGELDKPDFSFAKVIGQAIGRALTKIVTAPFRALGALLGGGEERIDTIAFAPGDTQLGPPQVERLKKLAEALTQRPQLKLMVTGRYDPKLDGAALRTEHVRRAVSAKLDIKVNETARAAPVVFDGAKTQVALEDLYETRLGKDAVDRFQAQYEARSGKKIQRVNPVLAVFGKASPDTAFYAELYKELVRTQPLADSELPDLAQKRSTVIVKALVDEAGLAFDRADSAAPKAVDEPSKEKVDTTLSLSIVK